MSEYIHAALLLHHAKKDVNEENIKSVMRAAGIEPDEARVKVLVSSLSSVNIDQVLSSQQAAVMGPGPAPISQATASAKAEEPKAEAKEEKKEEEFAGLGALFE